MLEPGNFLQARLVKIVAKRSLDIPLEELQFRLDCLLAIIPDLGIATLYLNIPIGKFSRLQACLDLCKNG